jgi:polysaccharide pyruvyl transferase WcaK-like protein
MERNVPKNFKIIIRRQFRQKLDEDRQVLIKSNLSAVGIKAFLGSEYTVISSRFHGCVSSLTQ